MKKLIIFIFALWSGILSAQDSTMILSYERFIAMVADNHPIAYQAQLNDDLGRAYVLKARGSFDPKLVGEYAQKRYDGKTYYEKIKAGFKIPTWYGITLEGGYKQQSGVFLNPENYLPADGLWNLGASVNIGQGLIIDQRRAELKQAKIYAESAEIQRQVMLNVLFLEAGQAYWDWYKSFNKVQIYKTAKEASEIRFVNVKRSAEIGEKAFVDTLKVAIQLQERVLKLEQAKLELANKRAFLQTFLWDGGFIPLEMKENMQPIGFSKIAASVPDAQAFQNIDSIIVTHPELLSAQNKVDYSKIEYRYKRDQLKPKVELTYNALAGNGGDVINEYTIEDYMLGAQIVYPIFTRKERGSSRAAKIKMQNLEADLENKNAQLRYKLLVAENSWVSTSKQVIMFAEIARSYEALYKAEEALFLGGESSIFLLNIRDQDRIDASIKYINMIHQNYLAELQYKFQTFTLY